MALFSDDALKNVFNNPNLPSVKLGDTGTPNKNRSVVNSLGGKTATKRGRTVITKPNGTREWKRADGTIIRVRPDGTRITIRPNGTRIIKRPDGSVTTKNPDGTVSGLIPPVTPNSPPPLTPGSEPGSLNPTLPGIDDPDPIEPEVSAPTQPQAASSPLSPSAPITLSRFGFDPLGKLPQFRTTLSRAGRPSTPRRSLVGGA